jgi:hypothetical protein
MTEGCPRCGALVTYFASDVGDTIECRSCGERVRVTPDGLERARGGSSAAPPRRSEPPPPEAPPPPAVRPAPAAPKAGTGILDTFGMVLGCLFLPGLFLTVLFLLLPVIHRAGVGSIDAAEIDLEVSLTKARQDLERKKDVEREDMRKKERDLKFKMNEMQERIQELEQRRNKLTPSPELDDLNKQIDSLRQEQDALIKQNTAVAEERQKLESSLTRKFRDDEDKIDKEERDNAKKRDKLELDRRAAEATMLRWSYWYQWGQLGGVLLLLIGSVGYLSGRQSVVRRVVGAVAIGAVILLVVAKMNSGRGVLLSMGGSGGAGKGLSAYNLSTPRDTAMAELDMVLNNDLLALVELRDPPGQEILARELQFVREKKATLKVHKEAKWKGLMLLFVSFQKDHKTTHEVEALEFVPEKGRWRPNFVSLEAVRATDPQLAREMEQWLGRSLPQSKAKDR